MNIDDKTILNEIRKIIYKETIYLRHYLAQVINVDDPDGKGKIRVACYDLGLAPSNGGTGLWVPPRDKNSIITPAINDWVEIYFMNGDRKRPVYQGIAGEMKDMLPENYDGKSTTDVIYEDNKNQIHDKYDSIENMREIGNSDMQPSARKTDPVKITIPINGLTGFTAGGYPVINVAPLDLTGTITDGSDQIFIGKK